ncbi:hypothetical protein D3C73_1202720 [compost metagenome]
MPPDVTEAAGNILLERFVRLGSGCSGRKGSGGQDQHEGQHEGHAVDEHRPCAAYCSYKYSAERVAQCSRDILGERHPARRLLNMLLADNRQQRSLKRRSLKLARRSYDSGQADDQGKGGGGQCQCKSNPKHGDALNKIGAED